MRKLALFAFLFALPAFAQVKIQGGPIRIGGNVTGGVTQVNGPSGTITGPVTVNGPGVAQSGSTLTFSGGGAGGVLPSSAAVELVTASVVDDDGAAFSPLITAGPWSCNGTTCDVNTTSAHGLSAGSYVYVYGLTGWFATPANLYPYDLGVAVFKVATVPSSTEFTFAYTANTGSGTGGNIRDASFWGSYQTLKANFMSGGAKFQYRFSWLSDLDTYFSTKVDCTLGSPTYLVIEVGQNDINNGDSEATMEAHFQSIWAKAHAAGCVVMQGTILPANYGAFASTAMWKATNDLNVWMRKQPWQYSLVSSNQYWDHLIDYATDEYDQDNGSLGQRLQHDFPQRTNEAFSHLGDSETGPPPIFMAYGNGSNNSIGFAPQRYDYIDNNGNSVLHIDYRDSQNAVAFNNTAGGNTPRLISEYAAGGLGEGVCKPFGRASTNAFMLCYVYANSSGSSASNYVSLINDASGNWNPSNELWRLYANGALQFPHYVASSGTQPLVVDAAGNLGVWTASTASSFPFTVIQQGAFYSANATSFTVTFPQALQASGATAFMFICTDNNTSPTTPTGWTRDAVYNSTASYSVFVYHIASAGQTSASWTSATASATVYVLELSGTRTFGTGSFTDYSSTPSSVKFPSITPAAGAAVFALAGYVNGSTACCGSQPLPAGQPATNLWREVGLNNWSVGGGRSLAGYVGEFTSDGTAVTPPNLPFTYTTAPSNATAAIFSIN